MRISDELRATVCKLEGYIHISSISNELNALADRIDAEMVELPRGNDWKPIHLGDTVYACDDPSLEYKVNYIKYCRDIVTVGMAATGIQTYREAQCVSHERPDSLERIADELEAWSEDNRVNGDDEVFSRAAYIAQRIRRLASEGASADGR